jgi:TPR repeat protein
MSCDLGAEMYVKGDGVAENKSTAAQLLQKGCDRDSPNLCVKIGIMYADGDGVTQNKVKAAQLYKKACDAGLEWGCLRLSGWTPRAQ